MMNDSLPFGPMMSCGNGDPYRNPPEGYDEDAERQKQREREEQEKQEAEEHKQNCINVVIPACVEAALKRKQF